MNISCGADRMHITQARSQKNRSGGTYAKKFCVKFCAAGAKNDKFCDLLLKKKKISLYN